MSPRFVLGRENVPCVEEVVNRSLKADCTDFNTSVKIDHGNFKLDLSGTFFDLQAVLSVTGRIGCMVFKWVENTNSNGP